MGKILDQARALRVSTQIAGRYLPDDVAFMAPRTLFDEWAIGISYQAGDKRRHGDGELYRCLQAHTSQVDWSPPVAVSLWVRIADPAEAWPEWHQPAGGHDAYALGAQVTRNGARWRSTAADNVWEPGVYGWTQVT